MEQKKSVKIRLICVIRVLYHSDFNAFALGSRAAGQVICLFTFNFVIHYYPSHFREGLL